MPVAVLALTIPTLHHRLHFRHHHECASRRCARAADRRYGELHHPRARTIRSGGESAVASYYNDHGPLACPWAKPDDHMAVASLEVPCGARVRLCHDGCVTATVDDHGPYEPGRLFDLNESVKEAIGCSDLCGKEGGPPFTWSRA